jgi:hypothetical protein
VTLPRGIYRKAHVALREAGVWLHVAGAGWGYERTGTCTSPQGAWRCGAQKYPDTSNSCNMERTRKNERKKRAETSATATTSSDRDEPPPGPSHPGAVWARAPQFTNGGQSGEHVDNLPGLVPSGQPGTRPHGGPRAGDVRMISSSSPSRS